MNKIITTLVILIAFIVGGFFWLNNYIYQEKQGNSALTTDYKNVAYEIDDQQVKFSENTKYFGNEARGDFNGDGTEDVAFILTQETGGSGFFYYVVAALKQSNGYIGTNAVFLGDRIAPQTTEAHAGKIIVNYADRRPGEPMVAIPTVGTSMYLHVLNGRLATTTAH